MFGSHPKKLCIVNRAYEEMIPFIEKTAQQAYDQMVAWFGPPKDEQRPYEVLPYSFTACIDSLLMRRYFLLIEDTVTDEAQFAALISHEMYHRVTLHRRRGLSKQTWVDELLAFLASQRFLKEHGYRVYASQVEDDCLRTAISVDFVALHKVRPKWVRKWLLLKGITYPPEFGPMVMKLGLATKSLLKWEDVCAMARVDSLEDWYFVLPEKDVIWIRALMTSQDTNEPTLLPDEELCSQETLDDFVYQARAYQYLRHFNAAVTTLQAVLKLDSEHAFATRILAVTLQQQGNIEAAQEAYAKALALNPKDGWLRYQYGRVLHHLGHTEQARIQWHHVVETNEKMAEAAHAALRALDEPLEAKKA